MASDQKWRRTRLDSLPGIPARAVKALHEAELRTVGALQSFLAKEGRTVCDIKGIGESAQQAIEDALERFFAVNATSATDDTSQGQNAAEVRPESSTPLDLRMRRVVAARAAVADAARELTTAEAAVKDAKAEMNAARSHWEKAVEALCVVIDNKPEQMELFEEVAPTSDAAPGGDACEAEADDAEDGPDTEVDDSDDVDDEVED